MGISELWVRASAFCFFSQTQNANVNAQDGNEPVEAPWQLGLLRPQSIRYESEGSVG